MYFGKKREYVIFLGRSGKNDLKEQEAVKIRSGPYNPCFQSLTTFLGLTTLHESTLDHTF